MRLMERVRRELRRRRYSPCTEKTYCGWIVRYIKFHDLRHPEEMAEEEALAFLNYLASERKVSASSQNQALAALVFLYRHVLDQPLGDFGGRLVRVRRSRPLPTVLSRDEIRALFSRMRTPYLLMAQLMYGSGLRLKECLSLRLKDVDFERGALIVRRGKGGKDRRTLLPKTAVAPLKAQIEHARAVLVEDLKNHDGGASLPQGLERKYPAGRWTYSWQYVFPANRISINPRTKRRRRHHVYPQTVGRAVSAAGRRAGICKRVGCHALRHSFATHLLDIGWDVRTVQELMGHKNINTTMIYLHLCKAAEEAAVSPLDVLDRERKLQPRSWPHRASPAPSH